MYLFLHIKIWKSSKLILVSLWIILLIFAIFFLYNNNHNNINKKSNTNNVISKKSNQNISTFLIKKERGLDKWKEKEYYKVKEYYNKYIIWILSKKQVIEKIKNLNSKIYDIDYMIKKFNILVKDR